MRLPLHIVITTHSQYWHSGMCCYFIPYLFLNLHILCIKSLIRLRLLLMIPLRHRLKKV